MRMILGVLFVPDTARRIFKNKRLSPFLVTTLLTIWLTILPATAATTAITINVNGTGSSTKISHTGGERTYLLDGTGSVTPFGSATFSTSGTFVPTSATSGTIAGSLTCAFAT